MDASEPRTLADLEDREMSWAMIGSFGRLEP